MFMDLKFTLVLFVCTRAVKLEIEGELSFSFKIPEGLGTKRAVGSQVTAGSVVEGIYQYPEQKQIDAILSNMMNVLTKVFVKRRELFTRESVSRTAEQRQRPDTRFLVVDNKNTQFFENIYHNMTDEYK